MKTSLLLSFLVSVCLLGGTQAQCDLTNGTFDTPFPDILKYVADSYVMGVEYSVPGAQQTDYYTEYYENEFKRGLVEIHQGGKSNRFLYKSENFEGWDISVNKCKRFNLTDTPEFVKDDMTDWMHNRGTEQFTTVGPSAMFKIAFDEWNKKSKNKTMAYMGSYEGDVRGEKAVYYRRCLDGEYSYADYFFADQKVEGAFDEDIFKKNVNPLRVAFYNLTGKDAGMANQFYDIISFRHQIPKGLDPFKLPKGQGCTRDPDVEGPKMPDYSNSNFLLNAEVIYRKISTKNNENELISSYYSTLMLALDRQVKHMAYMYSSWNTTKPDKDHQEPFVNAPKYIVFDMVHNYTYKLNYERASCSIARENSFTPRYKLPENGGSIPLNDRYVFFPNNEFPFLTKSTERGVAVNVYEAVVEDYPLDPQDEQAGIIPKMIVSRSYRTDNEETENTVAVRNALTQVEIHLFRKENIEEIVTFNIFGFTTRLTRKWNVFDISSCFRNEDDYLYLTLGFEPEPRFLPELEKKLPTIEDNVVSTISTSSELNAVRIPYIMSDVKNNFIFVTLLILGKPPLMLDFTNVESDKTVSVASQNDVQGVSTFDVCASNCLDKGCWGFSMCGNTCYYGTADSTTVVDKKNCTLYRRYTNETYIQSKEVQANNIVSRVAVGEFIIEVFLGSEQVQLKATVAQITDPGADDDLFQKMGNLLNPRMRVLKVASKLKKGSTIKNLGRLRYDECQKICLDFKDCETISYCLIDSECRISSKYGADLKPDEIEENNLCNLLTRKYTDHFDRSPGVFSSQSGGTTVVAPNLEDCARACLKQDKFKCLSFDHCAGGEREGCHLYTEYNLKSGAGKSKDGKDARCGHYARKFSTEFQRKEQTRIVGSDFETILNITLEDCAQRCYDYPGGACYGYDFCQDQEMYATSCTLIDSDPSRLKSGFSPICNNYARTGGAYAPRPYTTAYAGGIGFLCFLIGGVIGAVIVFGIAYFKMNRR